jgi:outer membrane lipoprotein SlyB
MAKKKIKSNKKGKQVSKREISALGKALRAVGGIAGGSLGGMLGNPAAGATMGSSLGAALSRWLGSGDYTVSNNSIVQRASNAIPAMHTNGQTVTIRHKEFITTVQSSINFSVSEFKINPGLQSTFPWLSNIARGFSEYKIKGMVYHYIPTSGSAVASTNNALGAVMLQTTYRSSDSAPANKAELLNEYWASEAMPCETFCHPIECDPRENPFAIHYIRSGSIPSGDSVLMYDLGKTFLAVQGQQANNVVLGDLWVTYEIELRKPILYSNVSYVNWNYFKRSSTGSATNLFSGSFTDVLVSGLDLILSGNTITFPPYVFGYFVIEIWVGAGSTFTVATSCPDPTLTNCTLIDITPYGGSVYSTVLGGAGGTLFPYHVNFAISIERTQDAAVVTFPTLPTTVTTYNSVQLRVCGPNLLP